MLEDDNKLPYKAKMPLKMSARLFDESCNVLKKFLNDVLVFSKMPNEFFM